MALLGGLVPGGEYLFSYFFLRRMRPDHVSERLVRHVAFQKSWWIYRSSVLLITLVMSWVSQMPAPSGFSRTEDFGGGEIVKEPEPTSDSPSIVMESRESRRSLRGFMQENREVVFLATMKRPEVAKAFLVASVGFTLYMILWLFAYFCTAYNFLRIVSGRFPTFPLTWPLVYKRLQHKIKRPE